MQRRPTGHPSGPFAALCAPLLPVATAAAPAQGGVDIGTDPAPDDSMSEDDASGLDELLFDRSLREILGLGHRIVDDGTTAPSVELGAGNRDIELVSGPSAGGPIAHFGTNYLQALGETVEFDADPCAEIGDDNRFVELELGLATSLGESFPVKLSHVARGNTDLGGRPTRSSPDATT